MKITLTPTTTIDTVNGEVRARIWEGSTDNGTPVKAWIATIQPQTTDETKLIEFERDLQSIRASRELVSFDICVVL
jgi:hypothetical protein